MRNSKIICFLLVTWLLPAAVLAQADTSLISHLKDHIYYLSSDKLKGRNTGSAGEKKSYNYIISQYKRIGLIPKGEHGFLQPFEFNYGKQRSGKNQLMVNGINLKLDEDFYPLNSSASGKAKGSVVDVGYGIIAPSIGYDSYKNLQNLKGSIFLIECSTPEGDSPHSKFGPFADIKTRIENAQSKGATAIIFTNTTQDAADLKANLDINTVTAQIPVLFLNAASLKKIWRSEFNTATITATLEKIALTGHNVAAFIDNGASTTAVIGAHYDHLGYGEYGNSLYRGEPGIHNGADDNASGTAAVIELARFYQNNGLKEKNNFLFLNFSGEELGLIGSKYWVEHPTLDTSTINYMINMDMIGRYDSSKGMEISGLGTSPEAFSFIRSVSHEGLKFKLSESGTGPTDHTSFYYANIPVLNFFTGTHEDYHKPSDDADKINYSGEASIIRLIQSIITTLDDDGILPFSRTKETDTSNVPQFKVRLGIIPDYLFDGAGLRVDGVDDGKPASVAGVKKGDIIIALGDYLISDIMTYMKALAAFQKGDTTTIIVKRGDMNVEMQVTF